MSKPEVKPVPDKVSALPRRTELGFWQQATLQTFLGTVAGLMMGIGIQQAAHDSAKAYPISNTGIVHLDPTPVARWLDESSIPLYGALGFALGLGSVALAEDERQRQATLPERQRLAPPL